MVPYEMFRLSTQILYTSEGNFPIPEQFSSKPENLLDRQREAIRIKHYSYSTEKTYVHWAKRYILFHKAKQGITRHPAEMGSAEIEAFLSHLAQEANVSAST
jgi:hypothetical protein